MEGEGESESESERESERERERETNIAFIEAGKEKDGAYFHFCPLFISS